MISKIRSAYRLIIRLLKIYLSRKPETNILMVNWWLFTKILYTIYFSGILYCHMNTAAHYPEFFTHSLSSLGSELPLNYWRLMLECFHLLRSSRSHLDLQKFNVESVDCLGNSGGNVSCHNEDRRLLVLWQFWFVWLLNLCFSVQLLLLVEKSLAKCVVIKSIDLIFVLSF